MKARFRGRPAYPHLAATAAVVLSASGLAFAAGAGTAGVINACAARKGGTLRVANKCRSNERRVSWNRQGPAGAPGANGQQGPAGAPGANGRDGQDGSPGTARAYAHILRDGTIDTARSKNVTSVDHATDGPSYCVHVAGGIDPAKTSPVVTIDESDRSSGPLLTIDSKAACAGIEVVSRQVKDGGGSAAPLPDFTGTGDAFFIVVP